MVHLNSILILIIFLKFVSTDTRPKPPKPNMSTCEQPSSDNKGLLANRVIFYAPSIIGEDTHSSKIDLYTDYFSQQHELHLKIIKSLGATHIIVAETWSPDGSTEHKNFIKTVNKYDLKIIVSFSLPSGKGQLEDVDYRSLRDNRKKDFVLLLQEFNNKTRPDESPVIEYIYFPAPVLDKMSTKDVQDFYDMVNTLIAIMNEKPEQKKNVIVGLPYNPNDGKIPQYDYGNVNLDKEKDVWAMSFYTTSPAFIQVIFTGWNGIWKKLKRQQPKFLPIITTDDYNSKDLKLNSTYQANNFCDMYNYFARNPKFNNLWGMGVWEFSDEWWRSNLYSEGFDPEGCPNGNPFAHTTCGFTIFTGSVLAIEYTGLYSIQDKPFQYCVVPKDIVQHLDYVWFRNNITDKGGNLIKFHGEFFNSTTTYCVPIHFIIHYYAIGPIFVLAMIALFLVLILDPPKPPEVKIDPINSNGVEMTINV